MLSHFTNEKTEAQRSWITCPKSASQQVAEWARNPDTSSLELSGLRLWREFRGPFIPEAASADYCRSKLVGSTGLCLKINFFFWKGSFSRSSNQLFSWCTFQNTVWAKQSQGQMPAVAPHGGGSLIRIMELTIGSDLKLGYSDYSFCRWGRLISRETARIQVIFLILPLSLTSGEFVLLWYPLNAAWKFFFFF